RRTVWWVKVTTALGALLLSMPVSAAMWAVLCFVWSRPELTTMVVQQWPGVLQVLGIFSVFSLGCLVITLAISPFCDRSLIASVVSILGCVTLYAAISSAVGNARFGGYEHLMFTLIGLTIPTFALISYWTFTRGESLRSARRFLVAAQIGGACLAAWVVVIGVGRLFLLW
ncbi:MAG: hypothetical protein M3Y28_00985, partial [Armatimonadota bacterium]|nr:hypothetical protein [Armatimonadota bacterium]